MVVIFLGGALAACDFATPPSVKTSKASWAEDASVEDADSVESPEETLDETLDKKDVAAAEEDGSGGFLARLFGGKRSSAGDPKVSAEARKLARQEYERVLDRAPYWAGFDRHAFLGKDFTDSSRELIGRTFLLAPEIPPHRAPRYDDRSLLTFTDSTLEEQRAWGRASYRIAYQGAAFDFRSLLGRSTFSIRSDKDGHNLFLATQSGSGTGGVETRFHGHIRELTADEAELFRKHLLAEAEAEASRVLEERRQAGAGPLPYLRTHDVSPMAQTPIDWIWQIYYGRFDQLDRSQIKGLYRQYHQEYSLLYGDSIDEPVTLNRSDLVTRDGWGNEKSRIEGHTYKIRTRFQPGYERSEANAGDLMAGLMKSWNGNTKTLDFGPVIDIGRACETFLKRYKEVSPGTVAHFETNLDHALFGRPAVVLPVPTPAEANPMPLLLPGEDLGPGIPESAPDYALSWVRPPAWNRVDRHYGVAVFSAGSPKPAEVIITYKPESIDDVLPYINLWREREFLEPVGSLAEQPMENLLVDGREAILISLPRAHQVLIHDGPRSWIVTMHGQKETVAKHLGELRDFVQSFRWTGVPSPPLPAEPQSADSPEDDVSTGGDTRARRSQPEPSQQQTANEPPPPKRDPPPAKPKPEAASEGSDAEPEAKDGESDTANQSARGVTLYSGSYYKGTSQKFTEDDPDLSDDEIGDDNVSSVRVDPGCKVELFVKPNYGGKSTVIDSDTRDFSEVKGGLFRRSRDNKTSSIRVSCRTP